MILEAIKPLFIDCQTTSSIANSSRIVEVGINEFIWLNSDLKDLSKKTFAMLGLTPEELTQGFPEQEIVTNISQLTRDNSDTPLIAHYAQFEIAHLKAAFERHNLDLRPKWICTHKLAKLLFPSIPSFGISALSGYFGHPIHEGKRVKDHIRATKEIWNAIISKAYDQKIFELEELIEFSQIRPGRNIRDSKKEYIIPKDVRLSLPNLPGIYKYFDRSGKLIYVGKATSLKSRVNSYFTGGTKRDYRKREMLSQATNLEFEVMPTPFHAGMEEFKIIRTTTPKYNIMYKNTYIDPIEAFKDIVHLSEQIQNLSINLNSSLNDLDKFKLGLKSFYGLTDINLCLEGVTKWRQEYPESNESFSLRKWIKSGLPLAKRWIERKKIDEATKILMPYLEQLRKANQGSDPLCTNEDDSESEIETATESTSTSEEAQIVWNSDLIAKECRRIHRRATIEFLCRRYRKRLQQGPISVARIRAGKSAVLDSPNERKKDIHHGEFSVYEPLSNHDDPRYLKLLLHELRRHQKSGGSWYQGSGRTVKIPFWVS
ncbi:MAG: GIY-YIG nuclease family protein [Proteobacteria bacterium]|nr:GIY-YIG nuclease family protein [Pseudomonadota bacterium]